MDTVSPVLSEVTRSERVESWHRGSLCVVQDGAVRLAFGDVTRPVYCRSAVKPLQALPLLEHGVATRFDLSDEELALASASHNGTDDHVAVAERMLGRAGFDRDDLLCGPHSPLGVAAGRALTAAGEKPQKIHNNCSGKHAGFLLLARHFDVPKEKYLDADSASQQLVRATVAEMAGLAPGAVPFGVDGCGAPTLMLSLEALARGFANLTNPTGLSSVRAAACQKMLQAITDHPVTLAGEGRLCTALIRSRPGHIYCKNGAEGVYALGLPGRGIGVAIKIDDGAERAYWPVIVDLLRELSFWDSVPQELADFHRVPVRNTQKRLVGAVTSVVAWPGDLSP